MHNVIRVCCFLHVCSNTYKRINSEKQRHSYRAWHSKDVKITSHKPRQRSDLFGSKFAIFTMEEGSTSWKWRAPEGRATHSNPCLWVSAWRTATRRVARPKLDRDMREKQAFILAFKNNGLRMGTLGLNSRTYNDLRTSYYCIMSISQHILPLKKKNLP